MPSRLSRTMLAIWARSAVPVGRTCSLISMRDSDSRSSIRRRMRSACWRMRPRNRVRAASSLRAAPCMVSMKPDSEASGVRSSWLALATKSARMRSICCSRVRSRNTRQRGTAQRRHMDIEAAGQRHAHLELHAMRLGPADGGIHRLQQGGRADRGRQMMAKGIGIESGAHMGIGGDDLAARRHHQHGIGQGHDQPLDAVIRRGHAFGIRLALAGCGCGLAEGPERRQQ